MGRKNESDDFGVPRQRPRRGSDPESAAGIRPNRIFVSIPDEGSIDNPHTVDIGEWIEIGGHKFRIEELMLKFMNPPVLKLRSSVELAEDRKIDPDPNEVGPA